MVTGISNVVTWSFSCGQEQLTALSYYCCGNFNDVNMICSSCLDNFRQESNWRATFIFLLYLLPSATKLRRLCFYRRLSVHRRGGGVCISACWDTTPQEQTPPWEQTPPGADTPPGLGTPPGTKYTPPRYGHCCGRYAPTGMHSCL